MAILKFNKTSKTELEENFKAYEFSCKGKGCCSKTLIDEKLVGFLQKIRDNFGVPVKINSAYRCASHNKAVGGSKNSFHLKGQAADISVQGAAPIKVAQFAEKIGIKGIGLYDNFVHIDTRSRKFFWYSDAQIERKSFISDNAVAEWQKAAAADGFNLETDGIWGSKCNDVARKAVLKKLALGYRYRNLTKIVQKKVGVTADGKFGKSTRDAVIKWQKLMGLKADGIVGLDTWKKMLGVR